MPSTFTWLDYSEHERRKMLDVIELFGERTTRDELGLGGVRDAFADLLFPGTSTIQTRARYALFIPWIYQRLERQGTSSRDAANVLRKRETELMQALEASDDSDGLIGRLAKGNVQRLPSSIYWLGLKVWGIRTFAGSQHEYHRSLDLVYARRRARRTAPSDFDGESAADEDLAYWHPALPAVPDGFPQGASFRLRRLDAEYLRERLLTSRRCSSSLLAYLVRERVDVAEAEFVWGLVHQLPHQLREPVEHGRNFSEAMHGAQLLYNLMLAERKAAVAEQSQWRQKVDEYRGKLGEWWNLLQVRTTEFSSWDRNRFWAIVFASNPRVTPSARRFINAWIDLVQCATAVGDVIEGTAARSLIEDREVRLKRNLARLTNSRPLELWPGAAGAEQLDLRWRAARRLVIDILDGLEADDA